MGRTWSGDSFKRKGYNGAGHWTGPHSGSSPIACHLQEIFVVSHVYKCMFIYMFHIIQIVVTLHELDVIFAYPLHMEPPYERHT